MKGAELFTDFKDATQYTFIISGSNTSSSYATSTNTRIFYTDGTSVAVTFGTPVVSAAGKTILKYGGSTIAGISQFIPDECGVFEGVLTADDFEAYTEQSATLDYTLRSVGDYADELTVKADGTGTITRRVAYKTLDGSESWGTIGGTTYLYQYNATNASLTTPAYAVAPSGLMADWLTVCSRSALDTTPGLSVINSVPEVGTQGISEITSLATFKAYLAEHPLTIAYHCTTYTEELTAAEVQAVLALNTLKPTTVITNDAGAEMSVTYIADTKTYIDNKITEVCTALLNS